MDGISFAFGTTKVKRQQQEIENLKFEKHELQQYIDELTHAINKERSENKKETLELNAEIIKIYDWMPETPTLIRWDKYCKKIGFTKNQAKDIIGMKSVGFFG